MTKIIDEDVIFKQRIIVPEISIEGGAGDLAIVDDLNVTGDATIGGNATLNGGVFVNDATAAVSVTALTLSAVCGTSYLSASQNVWSLAGFDQHIHASNILVMDASVVNIATETAFANDVTIGNTAITGQTVDLNMVRNVKFSTGDTIVSRYGTGTVRITSFPSNRGANLHASSITLSQSGAPNGSARATEETTGSYTYTFTMQGSTYAGGLSRPYTTQCTGPDTFDTTANYATITLAPHGYQIVNVWLTSTDNTALMTGYLTSFPYSTSAQTWDWTDGNTNYEMTFDTTNPVVDDAFIVANAITNDRSLRVSAAESVTVYAGMTNIDAFAGIDINFTAAAGTITMESLSGLTVDCESGTVSVDASAINIGTGTTYANEIFVGNSLGGDVTLAAASTIAADAPVINIGADTSLVQYVTIGHAGANNVDLLAATSITLDANTLNVGSTVVTGLNVGNTGAILTADFGTASFQAVASVDIDGGWVNIGTSTSFSNYVAIGTSANANRSVSIYGYPYVPLLGTQDGPSVSATRGLSRLGLNITGTSASMFGSDLLDGDYAQFIGSTLYIDIVNLTLQTTITDTALTSITVETGTAAADLICTFDETAQDRWVNWLDSTVTQSTNMFPTSVTVGDTITFEANTAGMGDAFNIIVEFVVKYYEDNP